MLGHHIQSNAETDVAWETTRRTALKKFYSARRTTSIARVSPDLQMTATDKSIMPYLVFRLTATPINHTRMYQVEKLQRLMYASSLNKKRLPNESALQRDKRLQAHTTQAMVKHGFWHVQAAQNVVNFYEHNIRAVKSHSWPGFLFNHQDWETEGRRLAGLRLSRTFRGHVATRWPDAVEAARQHIADPLLALPSKNRTNPETTAKRARDHPRTQVQASTHHQQPGAAGRAAKYDPRVCGLATGDHPFAPVGGERNYRQMCLGLYRKFNPKQTARIDELITKYSGREEALYNALLAKYVPTNPSLEPNRNLPAGMCRKCGKYGHWGNECPDGQASESGRSPAQELEPGMPKEPLPSPPRKLRRLPWSLRCRTLAAQDGPTDSTGDCHPDADREAARSWDLRPSSFIAGDRHPNANREAVQEDDRRAGSERNRKPATHSKVTYSSSFTRKHPSRDATKRPPWA